MQSDASRFVFVQSDPKNHGTQIYFKRGCVCACAYIHLRLNIDIMKILVCFISVIWYDVTLTQLWHSATIFASAADDDDDDGKVIKTMNIECEWCLNKQQLQALNGLCVWVCFNVWCGFRWTKWMNISFFLRVVLSLLLSLPRLNTIFIDLSTMVWQWWWYVCVFYIFAVYNDTCIYFWNKYAWMAVERESKWGRHDRVEKIERQRRVKRDRARAKDAQYIHLFMWILSIEVIQ